MATLNYDGLTHSALLDAWNDLWLQAGGKMADLAWGSGDQLLEVVPGRTLRSWPIRDEDTIPDDRAALLQLHGSLAWLRHRPTLQVWKFRLTDLRDAQYWDGLANGSSEWEPVVVLTDRKREAVASWPFDLAYRIFVGRLIAADRWLVAGYSFGDEPVNAALGLAAKVRKAIGRTAPLMLVIDLGHSALLRQQALAAATGYPVGLIASAGEGLPASLDSESWATWSANA